MYINTHSRKDMELSIREYLGCSLEKLNSLFEYIESKDMDTNHLETFLNNLILSRKTECSISEVIVYHLTRRLNEDDDVEGKNLFKMLSEENNFTKFLMKYNITFSPSDKKIQLFYKGKYVSLDKAFDSNQLHLRYRLGYDDDRDFCFNGFVLGDNLDKNEYKNILRNCPEIVSDLGRFFDLNDMIFDYRDNSQYYCYEYLVPFDTIVFDEKENLSQKDKEIYFIKKVLMRLYKYHCNAKFYNDCDNPCVRFQDLYCVGKEYFQKRTLIEKTI